MGLIIIMYENDSVVNSKSIVKRGYFLLPTYSFYAYVPLLWMKKHSLYALVLKLFLKGPTAELSPLFWIKNNFMSKSNMSLGIYAYFISYVWLVSLFLWCWYITGIDYSEKLLFEIGVPSFFSLFLTCIITNIVT